MPRDHRVCFGCWFVWAPVSELSKRKGCAATTERGP